jgi:ecotin
MAVDPNAPKVGRFFRLGGEPSLIRYKSRLPVVIYLPEGVEVRYRIIRIGAEIVGEAKHFPKGMLNIILH